MKNYGFLIAMLAAAVFSPVTMAGNYYEVNTAPTSQVKAYRPGQIIVKFKDDSGVNVRRNAKGRFKSSGVSAIDNIMRQLGVSEMEQLMPLTGALPANAPRRVKAYNGNDVELHDLSKLYCIKAEGNINVGEFVQKLQALPEVEYVEPNYLVYACASSAPNDPLYSQQWGIPAVNADKLWGAPTITDKRPVVAILDTGVDIAHPDLQANIWTNPAESTGSGGYDDDGNGFVDDVCGWDFVNQTGIIQDYNGHGTHCAGIAAAVGNNGIGICGANPDARIMPVTVMQSDGTGDIATIVQGIDYATANGADVISMSFGSYAPSIALESALARAYTGSVLVAAAGNDEHSITPGGHCFNDSPMFPAALTFVLGVQASTTTGLASFSNFDNDGPIAFNPFYFTEEQMYNYELTAPGTNILSTYPGGCYKSLNGTSMACPLVAGAISRLISVKEYATKEMLFGDLIHTAGENVDFKACYEIADVMRKPDVSIVSWRIEDEKDNDGRFDAGETIKLYPILRNEWGTALNTVVWLELGDNEGKVVEMSNAMVDFGKPLSCYAKGESAKPIIFKIKDDIVDGRHIKLNLYAQSDGMDEPSCKEIVATVENGVEIGGMITEDIVLDPNVYYIVTNMLAIPAGRTLTIKPGATLCFKNNTGLMCEGNLIAEGTPDAMITFTKANLEGTCYVELKFEHEIKYTIIEDLIITKISGSFENCIFRNTLSGTPYDMFAQSMNKCVIHDNYFNENHPIYGISYGHCNGGIICTSLSNTNLIHNSFAIVGSLTEMDYERLFCNSNNILCNSSPDGIIALAGNLDNLELYQTDKPSYYGSASESIVRNGVYDIEQNWGFSKFDLSNMLTQPNPEAHGIVWKVTVNDYDAQDDRLLPPLGVGCHKLDVWYSKVIDTSEVPTVGMGVRPPYTQTSISKDGSWRTEITRYNNNGVITEVPVSVYTAYVDIKGSMAVDGLNRIYVSGCKDDESFDIPIENKRFNVEVAVAGSMSTGFFATPGIGKVDLEWEDLDMNIEDIMGYNLYRVGERETIEWGYDENWNWVEIPVTVTDTIRINQRLIDEPHYTDFDVVPGQRYDYFYKVMRTDMAETSPSKVVSVVPLTASKGDANGSLAVDVADVVTEISYLTGGNPQPFIFEAADVNSDEAINILDVVGTINIIVNPQGAQAAAADAEAEYSIVDGILYVDSPVALGGLQFRFALDANAADPMPLEALDGFELVNSRTGDQMLMLAYSMSGKCLLPGKHAVAKIGDAALSEIVLSDKQGHNVTATGADLNGIIDATEAHTRLLNPVENPFSAQAVLPFYIAESGMHKVRMAFYDAQGHIMHIWNGVADGGMHSYTWNASGMPTGAYFVICDIDGKHVGSAKLIKK